ncbi:MAG: site-specific integrase [gamma proteobacterium endosymbiont of Lamellibrachia anaximandri]|nr:site-specific integrase [gamma proteobacterium endosymbiont of Lamellibrachia anaximandri]MBL3535703.1 site-specific integrase [gamma proteobacterium endosymbiont of Lamellibrachia anaximandri]
MRKKYPNLLAHTLRNFFSEYLPGLRGMSPHTIRSYRDTLVLLLRFLAASSSCDVVVLDLDDVTPQAVIAFLAHLENDRHNKTSTRNIRLAAIHAFFRYVAAYSPDRLDQAQRVLGVPFKRTSSQPIDYLEFDEIQAVFDSVDRTTPDGRRDYTLLVTMFNTGARVQEILDLHARDLQLTRPCQVRLCGKGRKVRICPLWPQTTEVLRTFCAERGIDPRSDTPLFLNHRGEPLTRYGIRYILTKHCERAKATTPSLARKHLHPHSMRHSTAIHMLKSGIDLVTISQWLGHASINTTNRYATVDLEMKRKAIAKAEPPNHYPQSPAAWRQDASILDWLESL